MNIFEPLIVAEILRDLEGHDLPKLIAVTFDDGPIVICQSAMTCEYVSSMIGALWALRDAGLDDDTIYGDFMDEACEAEPRFTSEWIYETWVAVHQRLALAALASTPQDA